MDQIFTKVFRFIENFGHSASTFSKEAWVLIATGTVVFGYMLLKSGNGR